MPRKSISEQLRAFWAGISTGRFLHYAESAPVTCGLILLSALLALAERIQPVIGAQLLFYPPLAFYQPYRFITAAFLHAGLLHLLFNMYALWLIGSVLERIIGSLRFAMLYILSAFAGNVMFYAVSVMTNTMHTAAVGASGAVFGLFGALLIFTRNVQGNTAGIAILLGINLALSFIIPAIAWQAHVGGLIGGTLLMWLWVVIRKIRRRPNLLLDILIAALIAALLVGILYLL